MPALSYSLVTLAELKAWIPVTGTGADTVLDFVRGTATRSIEAFLDRRIIFRAPAEVEGAANIVASVTLAGGAQTIAAQPHADGRTLIVTVVDANRSITAGLVTVTGTVGGVVGATEVFDLANGVVQYGVKFFTAITGVVVSALVGQAAGDTIAVGTSLGYVEYHFKDALYDWGASSWTGRGWNQDIYTRERPIINVREVNEDSGYTYGVSTRLVEGTDFRVSRSDGKLVRLSGGSPSSWAYAQRAVRDTYSAGYFTSANVPVDIKEVCLSLSDRIYKERGREGEMSHQDALGMVTRFSPAFLTAPMREQLMTYRRGVYDPSMTAEFDFDQEAA